MILQFYYDYAIIVLINTECAPCLYSDVIEYKTGWLLKVSLVESFLAINLKSFQSYRGRPKNKSRLLKGVRRIKENDMSVYPTCCPCPDLCQIPKLFISLLGNHAFSFAVVVLAGGQESTCTCCWDMWKTGTPGFTFQCPSCWYQFVSEADLTEKCKTCPHSPSPLIHNTIIVILCGPWWSNVWGKRWA